MPTQPVLSLGYCSLVRAAIPLLPFVVTPMADKTRIGQTSIRLRKPCGLDSRSTGSARSPIWSGHSWRVGTAGDNEAHTDLFHIQFGALDPSTIRTVVDKFLVDLQVQLDEKNVQMQVDELATDWFVRHGYSETMGARPMARLVQDKLKKPLAEEILFGSLADNGGDILVTAKDDEIVITFKAKEKRQNQKALSGSD